MWLLDVETRKLVYFMDDRQAAGKYAILSHTWDTEEVTFADIHTPEACGMKGYRKIEYTCKQAERDGLKYAWVDTACIAKDSSAELSEAINSMFKWYQMSAVCYVYITDAIIPGDFPAAGSVPVWAFREHLDKLLADCRWFTRGWTLQEMIAPAKLIFYDANWDSIGLIESATPNEELVGSLSFITGVPGSLLGKCESLDSYPLARKLSWAAYRETTRLEDATYSLLGLLGINMPLLYGKGGKAFTRLQEELLRTSTDRSLLLWQPHSMDHIHMLLAPDPLCFRDVHGFGSQSFHNVAKRSVESDHTLTGRGLQVLLLTGRCTNPQYSWAYLGKELGIHDDATAILLRQTALAAPLLGHVQRPAPSPMFEVVRAPSPDLRAHEFETLRQSLEWIELLIHRNARSNMFVLDMDRGIECNDPSDSSRPSGITEVAWSSRGKKLSFVLPASIEKENLSIGSLDFDHRTHYLKWARTGVAETRVPGTRSIVHSKVWSATSGNLPESCKLHPSTIILRIWISAETETYSVMFQQSLPTRDCISRLWKVERPITDAT